jgi:hypothetical protein
MTMKKSAFVLILMASACSSEVGLELNITGPKEEPPQGRPGADPLGDLAWSFIAPEMESSEVTHVEWIPDGGVIAAGGFSRRDGRVGGDAFLARIAADGSPVWLTEIEQDDLVELVGGIDDAIVEYSTIASLVSMDRFDDGRILVALNLEARLQGDGWAPGVAFFAFLRWYEGDGNLLETRPYPEPADRGPRADDDESYAAADLGSVLALPDGGGLFTGRIGNGGPDTVVEIVRFDADGEPVWTTTSDTGESIRGLTATPDGGILLHGMFFESVTVGDQTVEAPETGAFAARLEADEGTCTWLQSFDGASHLLSGGGIGSAPGGNVIAAGLFFGGSVQAGELELSAAEFSDNYFLSELTPDGEVLSLSEIEHLPPWESGVNDLVLTSAAVGDGTVVMGGQSSDWNHDLTAMFRTAFIATFDFSGQLLAERRMVASQHDLDNGAVDAVAIAPDGGVLAGGFWEHEIDLGDGDVLETTEPQIGQLFVALYDLVEEDSTVDLITTP